MARSERLNRFIINSVEAHPKDVVRLAAAAFGVSRQTVINHIDRLEREGVVEAHGRTRARRYGLKTNTWAKTSDVVAPFEEDRVWREQILPYIRDLPENVLGICNYGCTEMLNNVAEHSESPEVMVRIDRTALRTQISIGDVGIGIFNKLQQACGLDDPRQALLELSKGKLTSDPEHHTGEGIFFTSRMFDEFMIISGTSLFHRTNQDDDQWLVDLRENPKVDGTIMIMIIRNESVATAQETFDKFASPDDDYGFSKTHIPIQLALYEGEQMVSRSQAKRILARAERFKEVILDFTGVKEIGQGFADEVFRVFAKEHPDVNIVPMFTTPEIEKTISRARWGETVPNEPQQLSLLSPVDAPDSAS